MISNTYKPQNHEFRVFRPSQHLAELAFSAMYLGFEGEFYICDIEILEPSGQVMYSLISLLTLSNFA